VGPNACRPKVRSGFGRTTCIETKTSETMLYRFRAAGCNS
jgi:hypothetical protein